MFWNFCLRSLRVYFASFIFGTVDLFLCRRSQTHGGDRQVRLIHGGSHAAGTAFREAIEFFPKGFLVGI